MVAVTVVLFGMETVAREIQDPFGFDSNDLNVYSCTAMKPTSLEMW